MMFQMIPAHTVLLFLEQIFPLSVAGVWISNPITMPPMMYFGYLFGNKVLGLNPVYDEFKLDTEWIVSALANIWEPLLIGTLIIGVISSIVGYFLMHIAWRVYAYAKLKQRKADY